VDMRRLPPKPSRTLHDQGRPGSWYEPGRKRKDIIPWISASSAQDVWPKPSHPCAARRPYDQISNSRGPSTLGDTVHTLGAGEVTPAGDHRQRSRGVWKARGPGGALGRMWCGVCDASARPGSSTL